MIQEKEKETVEEVIIEEEDTSSDKIITHPFSPSEIELISPPMNLGDLIDKLAHGEINLDTDFQREGNLWEPQKQSRLIESVLLGLRLPAFYFEKVEKKRWDVIDGLQRCWAIKNFCVDKTLSLVGLEFLEEFNGKTFDDLDYDFQRDIKMSPVTVNLLTIGLQKRAKYILFQRLNTGGVELTPQEIRNAVFQGPAIETVKKMAKHPWFIKATQGKIPTKRKQHEDFVSRFIAFYITDYRQYYPDLNTFINDNMELLSEKETGFHVKMMEDFAASMELAYTIFKQDAFRKRLKPRASKNPINKAYFEVIAVTFAKLTASEKNRLLENQKLFKTNLLNLMQNRQYFSSLSSGTGKRESVLLRFSLFNEVVNESIKGEEWKA